MTNRPTGRPIKKPANRHDMRVQREVTLPMNTAEWGISVGFVLFNFSLILCSPLGLRRLFDRT